MKTLIAFCLLTLSISMSANELQQRLIDEGLPPAYGFGYGNPCYDSENWRKFGRSCEGLFVESLNPDLEYIPTVKKVLVLTPSSMPQSLWGRMVEENADFLQSIEGIRALPNPLIIYIDDW